MGSRMKIVCGAGLMFMGLIPAPTVAQRAPSAAEARADLRSSDATERAMAACHLGRMKADDVRPAREALIDLLSEWFARGE